MASYDAQFGLADRRTQDPQAPGFYPKSKCREASAEASGLFLSTP
jgi:hypothetical protein